MTHKPDRTDPLETFFEAARAAPAEPDAALMARVLADAGRVQAERRAAAVTRPLRAVPGWRATLAEAIGGWPAMAGLAAAMVAGIWIGVSPPAALAGIAQTVLGGASDAYLVDLDPAATFQITEGAL